MTQSSKSYIYLLFIIFFCLEPGYNYANTFKKESTLLQETEYLKQNTDPVEKGKKRPFFGLGINAGISISSGYYDYKRGIEPPNLNLLYTPTVSLSSDLRFAKVFSLRSDLRYHAKGDQVDVQKWLDQLDQPEEQGDWITLQTESTGYIRTTASYVELSLIPTFHLGDWIHFGVGGYASIGLFGKEVSNYTIDYLLDDIIVDQAVDSLSRTIEFSVIGQGEDTEITRYFNILDYGLVGLFGFGHKPFTVDLIAQFGMETWQSEKDLFGLPINLEKTYHMGLMITVSYWFL